MSTFTVPVTKIDEIRPHPNADRLEIASIKGWQCVVAKGVHKAGDIVVYIPEGAILPKEIQVALGLDGVLAGREKNRIKTVRLRGEYSQGVVMPLGVVQNVSLSSELEKITPGMDLADALGIVKYEPPIPVEMSGIALPRPTWMHKYSDLENINNFPNAFDSEDSVYVFEKIHGSNVSFGMSTMGPDPYTLYVSSRNVCLVENDSNLYWRAAKQIRAQERMEDFLRSHAPGLLRSTGILLPNEELRSIVLFGEVFGSGVQSMDYGCAPGEIKVKTFDVSVNGRYLSVHNAMSIRLMMGFFENEVVSPDGFIRFSLDAVREYAARPSGYWDGIREGVVVRSRNEKRGPSGNRLVLKAINPAYLVKDQTEYH